MKSGIYKILNKANGKFYIGSAVDLPKRWREHQRYLNNKTHHNTLLQRAWNKYWNLSFEFVILEICDKEILLIREQFWLDWTTCYNLEIGYNLSPTAGNSLGVRHNKEARKRMSEAKKKMTEETKLLMSTIRKGVKPSEETKLKMSEARKGRTHSEETRIKIGNANRGRKASEETKKRISAGNKNLGTKRGKYRMKNQDFFEKLLTNNAPTIGY